MATLNGKIIPPVPLGVDIEDEMRRSYIDYSMSVIVAPSKHVIDEQRKELS